MRLSCIHAHFLCTCVTVKINHHSELQFVTWFCRLYLISVVLLLLVDSLVVVLITTVAFPNLLSKSGMLGIFKCESTEAFWNFRGFLLLQAVIIFDQNLQLSLKLVTAIYFLSLSRFKNFSLLLEELYNRQTQWTIPDTELREAVRLAVAEVLLPAYRSFIKRYRYSLTMVLYAFSKAGPNKSAGFFSHV